MDALLFRRFRGLYRGTIKDVNLVPPPEVVATWSPDGGWVATSRFRNTRIKCRRGEYHYKAYAVFDPGQPIKITRRDRPASPLEEGEEIVSVFTAGKWIKWPLAT